MTHHGHRSSLRKRLDDIIRGETRICVIGIAVSISMFQVGFDVVATAGFQGMVGFLSVYGYKDPNNPLGYNLSTHVQTLVQSLLVLGSLISSLSVYLVGSRISRRAGLWTACVFSIVGVTIQLASTKLSALYAGRFLLGFSNGIFSPYTSMYITESVPSFLRGSIIAVTIFISNTGGLVGVIINNATQTRTDKLSYQIPMAVTYITPLFIGILLFFLPDTPRYYILKGDYDKAANSLRRLRGVKDEAKLREEVDEMKSAHIAEQQIKGKVHLLDLLKGTDLRRTLLIYGMSISQVATGRGFLAQFSVYFLAQARVPDPFLWVMITYVISLTGNLVGSALLRYTGRKTLLVPGLACMAVAMFVMAITYTVHGSSVGAGRVLVAMYIVHTWIGAATTMPSAATLTADVASQRLRPEMTGTSSLIAFGLGWLIAYTSPYFINPEQLNWGPKYAYIWAASCVVLAAWSWLFLPETMGRSLEQIDEMFEKRVPARKFKGFQAERANIDDLYERRTDSSTEDGIPTVERVGEPVQEEKGL